MAVEKRLHEIFDAAESKDMDRLDTYHLYEPRFTKFTAQSNSRQNAEEARTGEHAGLGAIEGLSMKAEDLKIDLFGDVAIATFLLDYRYRFNGNLAESKERSTMVFLKHEGEWKIVHEHFSVEKLVP